MSGRNNPPEHSRFRPGQSGNPSGRPKGRRSFKADLVAVLSEQVQTDAGLASKQRALLERLVNAAVCGDANATKIVIALCTSLLTDDHDANAELTPDQAELMQEFTRRQDSPSDSGKPSENNRPQDSIESNSQPNGEKIGEQMRLQDSGNTCQSSAGEKNDHQ
jgi:hypothetical protein